MFKKNKEASVNLYYMNNEKKSPRAVNDKRKTKERIEREKRIKKQQKEKEDYFNIADETVIQMTNKNKLKKEQELKNKNNREIKKRRKRLKKIRRLIFFITLILLASTTIAFALTSPIFNIKKIETINNNKVTEEMIISLSGLKENQNIFKFYKRKVIKNIKENPYIEDARICVKYPDKIQIDIKERKEEYGFKGENKIYYIDNQGYILDSREDSTELPMIEGFNEKKEYILGSRLDKEELIKLEEAIKILDSVKENGMKFKNMVIDVNKISQCILYIPEENKKIHFGDTKNLSNKMLYVIAIMEEKKEKPGDIFVNGDLNGKFRPYFKEKV